MRSSKLISPSKDMVYNYYELKLVNLIFTLFNYSLILLFIISIFFIIFPHQINPKLFFMIFKPLCQFNDFIIMHQNSYKDNRRPKDHTISTSPAFNSSSFGEECPKCATYEEDIGILQDKLMETHNKLIEQIDLCREQEIKLIELMKNRHDDEENNYNGYNVREKSHGKGKKDGGKKNMKNYEDDYDYHHSVQPLIEAKTQLLRNDLEAMRNKVLTEIKKSNKLQQLNRELQQAHDKEISEYRERIRKIEASRSKLIDSNEKLREQCLSLQKQLISKDQALKQCACGFQNKYYELDQAFMNQRTIMNQLIEQNNAMENQLHSLKVKFQQQQYGKRMDFQPEENYNYEIRTDPKKKKGMNRQKKKEQFEQTKSLIKKLEIAEKQIRTRKSDQKY